MNIELREVHSVKRKPNLATNYHLLSNNAVFPNADNQEVVHNHTKVVRHGKPQLKTTLRKESPLNEPVLVSRGGSPEGVSEYKARSIGYVPEYQQKLPIRKKAIDAPYEKNRHRAHLGGGVAVRIEGKDPEEDIRLGKKQFPNSIEIYR